MSTPDKPMRLRLPTHRDDYSLTAYRAETACHKAQREEHRMTTESLTPAGTHAWVNDLCPPIGISIPPAAIKADPGWYVLVVWAAAVDEPPTRLPVLAWLHTGVDSYNALVIDTYSTHQTPIELDELRAMYGAACGDGGILSWGFYHAEYAPEPAVTP